MLRHMTHGARPGLVAFYDIMGPPANVGKNNNSIHTYTHTHTHTHTHSYT